MVLIVNREDKVSIIVPVYNVEKYLDDCLTSLITQSYKNLEIILINDGSTDNSGEICKKYSMEDNRIIYLEKQNGGLSSARNYGLKFASGEYLFFIDSDDYIMEFTIESMLNEQQKHSSDIVAVSFRYVSEDSHYMIGCQMPSKIEYQMGSSDLFFAQIVSNHACAKLYKRKLFDGINFPEGRNYEDMSTTFYLFDKCECVSYTEQGLYSYRARSGAITSRVSIKDIEDMWFAYDKIKLFFRNEEPNYIFFKESILYTIYSSLTKVENCDYAIIKVHRNKIYKELSNWKHYYFRDGSVANPKMNIKICLMRLHLAWGLMYVYHKKGGK